MYLTWAVALEKNPRTYKSIQRSSYLREVTLQNLTSHVFWRWERFYMERD